MKPRLLRPCAVVVVMLGAGLLRAAEADDAVGAQSLVLAQLSASAQQGDPNAQLELALSLDSGARGQANHAQAIHWYQQAAARGVGVAHLMLGMSAEAGDGLPQSYAVAREHYEKAVALGVPQANLRLGVMHLEGWGVARDGQAALPYILKAAEVGYRPAQTMLADIFMLGIGGVDKNPAAAVHWAERAAQKGDAEAEFQLGRLTQKGLGLPADVKRARDWYQLSSGKEYTNAMIAMAGTFFSERSDPDRLRLGMRWLELAAENGSGVAAFRLAGFHLIAGQRDGRAAAKGRELLEQAEALGVDEARETLKLIAGGRAPHEAFQYVIKVPYEQRYVERLKDMPTTGDRPPRIVKTLRPTYPAGLKLTETKGEVTLQFVVDREGNIREPRVVASTHPGFEENALAALREWRFEPGIKNGQPVNARMQVPIRFEMPK